MKKNILKFYYLLVWAFLFAPNLIFAKWKIGDSIVPNSSTKSGGGHFNDIIILIDNLLYVFIWIAIPVSALLFAWIGWDLISNESKPSAKSAAKERLKTLLIGMFFVLAPWLVVKLIIDGLGASGAGALL